MIKIKSIHIYPIKSLGAISLQQSKVTHRGLAHDRRWMLVDAKNRFVSQREYAQLSLLEPEIVSDQMIVTDRSGRQQALYFDLKEPQSRPEEVIIWDDTVMAKAVSTAADEWFSRYMEMPVRLIYMPDESVRAADPRYAVTQSDKVSFADGYPILIISEASMDLLNSKLTSSLSIDRFRANLIVEGSTAHEEDTWREIQMAQQTLYGVKPCGRCVMTTIDPKTAEVGKEPLKTLATYRKVGQKILFGENFIPKEEGVLRVGDKIKVVKNKEPLVQRD